MALPVFVYHKGNPYYLKFVLKQIQLFNPDSKIILLGDGSNVCYDFVEHHFVADYSESSNLFASKYTHYSTNSIEFERGCIQRWFIINEFIRKNVEKLDLSQGFFVQDSDVMSYCNVTDFFSKKQEFAMAVTEDNFVINGEKMQHVGVQNVFFRNEKILSDFCAYCMHIYETDRPQKIFELFQSIGAAGGMSDMMAFAWYIDAFKLPYWKMDDISNDGYFTNNIKDEKAFKSTCFSHVKIVWKNKLPYGVLKDSGKLLGFNTLHCQGGNKTLIPLYYSGKKDISFTKHLGRHWIRLAYKFSQRFINW